MEEIQFRRYFLRLSYDGTNFCGWQFQKNNESVQESIEKVLTILCKSPQKILGCGRTDTGVHADDFYAHWDYPFELPEKLMMKMNTLLPRSIAIKEIFEVPKEAHARFDATARKYHYFIHVSKNPFKRLYSYEYLYHTLNYDLMQKVATKLLDFNEFLPLIKLDKEHKKTKCTLFTSELIQLSDTEWRYEVSANRFLHNMVRRIVGTMLLVGRNKLSFEEFVHAMETQTDMKYIQLAPSNGLHLVDITYPLLQEKNQQILL